MNIHSILLDMESFGKRQKILDGALAMFEAKGFHGTAVPEIAAASGVAVGTIYRHFPNKEKLVQALLAECRARFRSEVLAAIPATASPRAVFRLYWRRMAGFARAFPLAQRFLDLHDHASYAAAPSDDADDPLMGALRELIGRGRREGVMKALDPLVVTALLRGALAGLARHGAREGVVPQPLVEEMEDCLWNAVASR